MQRDEIERLITKDKIHLDIVESVKVMKEKRTYLENITMTTQQKLYRLVHQARMMAQSSMISSCFWGDHPG